MAKSVVEDCKRVSIKWLKQHGYLIGDYRWGGIEWTSGWDDSKSSIAFSIDTQELYIRFQYTQTDYYTDEKSEMDYRFRLTTSPCNYGGLRYWFVCGLYKNGVYCGRKTSKLYLGGKWFGCRHCWDLSYYDRQQNRCGKFSFLFKAIDFEEKAAKLEEKMKHWYWQGRPTKKHRRLLRYVKLLEAYSPLINSIRT